MFGCEWCALLPRYRAACYRTIRMSSGLRSGHGKPHRHRMWIRSDERSRMRSCSWPSNLDVVKPLHSRLARVLCCVCPMMDVNGTIFIRSPAEAHLVLRTSFPHGRVARVSARHTHTDSRHISQMQTDLGCTYIPPPTSSHSHTLSPCMLPLLRLLVRIKSFTCPC